MSLISLPLPEGRTAFSTIQSIADARKSLPAYQPEAQGVDYLINLLEPDDFYDYPELLEFALTPVLLDAVTRYLGTVPILAAMRILYTPPHEIVQGSQLFHRDQADFRQAKLFLNINDGSLETGPFTFVPANYSEPASRRWPPCRS